MFFRIPKATEPEILASTSDYSIFDLAEDAGFLLLNPSDLVFESNDNSINYYDYIISVAQPNSDTYQLYLAKLNEQTNIDWYESVEVTKKAIQSFELPETELTMIIIAALIWKRRIAKSKVLCLINLLRGDTTQQLQALKKTMDKLRSHHHVICFEKRKTSDHGVQSNRTKWQESVADSMRLRVMMCEFRTHISNPPTRAIREASYVLSTNFNPFCCICLPFS